MRLLPFVVFALWLTCTPCSGQKSKKSSLVSILRIEAAEATSRVRITTLIPNDVPYRQTVHSLQFTVEPDTIYCVGNNKYAEFDLTAPIPSEITIYAELTLYNSGYNALSKQKAAPDSIIDEKYIRPAQYIDSDAPEIVAQARKLKRKTDLSTLKAIYDYVSANIVYAGYLPIPQGSLVTYREKRGDCSDFSHLMAALCRANGIPSRVVYGITCSSANTPKHDWVEAHLTKTGWVTFDPTPGNEAGATFVSNRYIYLCPNGNDDIMQKYYFYRYSYWGTAPTITMLFLADKLTTRSSAHS